MRMRRLLAVAGLAGVLTLGGAVAVGSTESVAGAATGPTAVCARLADRVAEIPGIQDRIRSRLDEIERSVDAVRDPARRARLLARVQPRIDALRALDQRLTDQVARAEAKCPRVT